MKVLVESARNLMAKGKVGDAFALLLHSIRLTRGEDAILQVLDSVKKKFEVDVLSDEMNGVSLAEAEAAMDLLINEDTILKEQGMEDILSDAFEDGSSVVCKNCGGLIAKHRWSDHVMYWCSASGMDVDEDMDTR